MGMYGARVVVVLLALLLWTAPVCSQSTVVHRLSADTRKIDLSGWVAVLTDASGTLTAAQVGALAASGAMTAVANPKTPMLRERIEHVVWLKLDVAADPAARADWRLVIWPPIHDHNSLYVRARDGSWTPVPAIRERNIMFDIRTSPGEVTSMLLRVQDSGAAPVKATLWQPDAFWESERLVVGLYCLYFGLLGGMMLYNLMLYVVVRDSRYLIYVGFMVSLALGLGTPMGLGAQYLWGGWDWWNARATYLGQSLMVLTSITLTRRFLGIQHRVPGADKVMRAIAWLAAAAGLASVLMPHIAMSLIVPAVLSMSLMTTGLSVLAMLQRWPGAGYFGAAWLLLHVGSLVALANYLRIVPWSMSATDALALGTSLEMVLLSLALADRIVDETRRKEHAQARSLAVLQAARDIGLEIRLDSLRERLRTIMFGLVGATRVDLVMCDASPADPLVHTSLVHHVSHTRQAVISGRSLGLPVLQQGSLVALLLLERSGPQCGFTPADLDAVHAVAGPLAVTLENVLLYKELEQRVAEQMGELQDAQKDLEQTARRAGQAEAANSVLHNVGNLLNSVNTSAQLVNSKVNQSRSQGLVRAVELMTAHAGGVADFIERDPRGRALPDYLKELVAELAREREEVTGELAHLRRGVHHIRQVVAAQQQGAVA